jgi:acyl carrier protein
MADHCNAAPTPALSPGDAAAAQLWRRTGVPILRKPAIRSARFRFVDPREAPDYTGRTTACPAPYGLPAREETLTAMTMSRDDVFNKVRDIIVENLGADPTDVSLETSFRDDLEADSLDLAELIMDFEDKFGVGDISEDEALKIQTVGDAVDYIYNELAAA